LVVDLSVQLVFFASSFCEPCIQTRAVLDQASKLVPALKIAELDVARETAEAERAGIRSTPTVVILDEAGSEVFRAEGVPSLNQVLVALAKAV
jgi:thiol-disulfide isomerase/thioredoxin